jgi:uroporphyrin-III C-methyltransferase
MLPFDLPAFERGFVWLVGAGPGDPGLITLAGLHALRHADVIVYDALVDARILALAHPHAQRVYAGKRGGRPSPEQIDISQRLIRFAREGKRVLRLKGGDPFVFGRGGEEALALVAAGVPFRIVPGVTAGIGGLAYAGIPLTHRDTNHAVTFITGHGVTGDVPDGLDWRSLAQGAPALILYMALKHIGTIAARLLEAGRSADDPVAIVCHATTARQAVIETTLARLTDGPPPGAEPPAIVAIGESVRLRAGLDWVGALAGRVLEADPLGRARHRDAG